MTRIGERHVRWICMLSWLGLAPIAFVHVINSRQILLDLPAADVITWSVLYLITGVALWFGTARDASSGSRLRSWCVFAVASGSAIQIFTAGGNLGGFLIMSAGIAAGVLNTRALALAIGVQSLNFMLALRHDLSWSGAVFLTVVFVLFQGFTAFLVKVSQQEYESRLALARTNAHLNFTQALLQQASADAERRRISRELHDGLGHHLTLLNLELELASAVPDYLEQHASLGRAVQLNRDAMLIVRENIQELRLSSWDELRRVQQAVAASAPNLQLILQLPEPLPDLPQPLIHLCLRFLQESLANTIKYASASTFEFRLGLQGGHLILTASDDGTVLNIDRARSGFSSLRERVEAAGGTLRVRLQHHQPVLLHANIPVMNGAG